MKRVKDCKDANFSARWTVKTDKFTLFVYCNFLVVLSTTVCSQNLNKQNVNIADGSLTDYSFLSRHYYTKSKNYLERRYRKGHWILMFIGTPCTYIIHRIWIINFTLFFKPGPTISWSTGEFKIQVNNLN